MSTMDVMSNDSGGIAGVKHVDMKLETARDKLIARGVEVSEVLHGGTPGADFHHDGRASGPDRDRGSNRSCSSFRDPDGKGRLFQEVTTRLRGRIHTAETAFASLNDLASTIGVPRPPG